jgi:uncharacterized membrane protein YbhN (UPF0104 family)
MGRKAWLNALKLVLTLASLYLIARRVDFKSLLPILARCRPGFVLASVAALVGNSFLTAWRWRLMWNVRGLPLRKYLYFVYVGYFFSSFLPSAATSEAIRIIAFGRKYGAVQESIGVNILARGLGFLLQLAIGAASIWTYRAELRTLGIFAHLKPNGAAVTAGAALLIAGGALVLRFRARLTRQKWLTEIRRILEDKPLLAKVAAVTLLIQLATILSLWCLFMSLYPQVRLWQIVLFPALIQVILFLPISFGGVGVREYLNILFFSDFAGIPRDTVFAVSILGYVPILSLALWGWAWMMFRRMRSAE